MRSLRASRWICAAFAGGLAAAVVACGSSDTGGTGTGSSGGQGLLSGTWSYTATGSTGDTVCSITGAVLSLTSAGPNVTGTFSNANISCTNTTISFTASDSVTNGVYSALSLAFDLDTGGIILHNTGKANSALTAMSGIVVVKYLGDSILTGTWSATRTGN